MGSSYYNKFWLEAQHPAGFLSFSCLSYNEGSNWLVETCGWNEYLVTVMNMLLNFVTEYLFDTFVVFRGSMDTNDLAKKTC